MVLTQDIRVLAGLQRGLHQPGFTHLALSSEERRVINMHRNLERYLDLPRIRADERRHDHSIAVKIIGVDTP